MLTIVYRSTLPFTCRHCTGDNALRCCNYLFRMKSTEAATSTCSVKWIHGNTASAEVFVLPKLPQSPEFYAMTFEPYNGDFTSGSKSLWRDYLIPPVMVIHLSFIVFNVIALYFN